MLSVHDGAELPAYEDEDAWEGCTVDGEWLASLIRGDEGPIHRLGVFVTGARIVGNLDLNGATLDTPLLLLKCQLGSSRIRLDEARARSVRLPGCQCGGVGAMGAHIDGVLMLRDGFRSDGEVTLRGAEVTSGCDFRAAHITHSGEHAIAADHTTFGGSVWLNHGFTAVGEVRFGGTRIKGDFDCTDGSFTTSDGFALFADGARVDGSIFLNGVRSRGEIHMLAASVGNTLECTGAMFEASNGNALSLDGSSIERALFLRPTTSGPIRVVDVRCGPLIDSKDSWPANIALDGFSYGRLESTHPGWRDRANWLCRQPSPRSQPYLHLASVYRATGDDRDARKILIERYNALLDPPDHWKSHLPSGLKRLGFVVWRSFLRYTIGHGYEPWRVAAFAAPLIFAMSLAFTSAKHHDVMRPTGNTKAVASKCDSTYPCLQPVVYALDTLLPIIDFGQAEKWAPDQSRRAGRAVAVATWFTIAAGWVFATLVVASFTQVVRRE